MGFYNLVDVVLIIDKKMAFTGVGVVGREA